MSRSKAQKLNNDNLILVNGEHKNNSYIVEDKDVIELIENKEYVPSKFKGENIPLDIVYEDEDIVIINKASGMVVHPASGNYENTLVNALIYRYNLDDTNVRSGIVHRIDKGTQNESRLLYIKGFHFEMDPENKRMIDKDNRDRSNYYLANIKYDLKLLRISYDDSNNIQHISETILDNNNNNSTSLTHESENTNESYTMEYTSSPIDLDAKIQELRNSDTTNYTKENFITYYAINTRIYSYERDIFLKVGNAVVYRNNQIQYLNETIWDI